MKKNGYGGKVFFESVEEGSKEGEPDSGFAENLGDAPPQSDGCGF